MPHARMLSKKISNDDKVANLSIHAALLYTWCIPYLDVKGRIHGDVWTLKSIVPHVDELTPQRIKKCVEEFVKHDLVVLYGCKQRYLQFNGFFKNQKIYEEKEGKSVIPDPTPDLLQSKAGQTPPQVKESKVKESKVLSDFFNKIWDSYPKKVGRRDAIRHYNATVKIESDMIKINKALSNYKASERVMKGYIQNGSTWFNNWEDWVDFKEDSCRKCRGRGKFTSTTGYEISCDCKASK